MKIVRIQSFYPRYREPLEGWRSGLWQIVVRVESDLGLVGWGYGGGGLAATAVIDHHLGPLVTGRPLNSIDEIAALWDTLYNASIPYGRKGVAIMALSALDLALWDLLGQAERQPVYRLIPGSPTQKRERIRAYATGSDPAWYAELGFTAHKLPHRWPGDPAAQSANLEATARWAEQSRALFGPDAPLMLDCYMSWDAATTRRIAAALSAYNLHWFEDVCAPDLLDEQATLRAEIHPVQLAGGEHEFTHFGFAEIARAQALDIWQPDITWCGGITAGLRIVELAARYDMRVVPHRGGEVWGLHLIAATDCEDLGEVLPGRRNAPAHTIWHGEPQARDGYLYLSDAPGFGVEPDESVLHA